MACLHETRVEIPTNFNKSWRVGRIYNEERLEILKGLLAGAPVADCPTGRPPRAYLDDLAGMEELGGADIKAQVQRLLEASGVEISRPLDRQQVLEFCQNPEMPTLGAFALCMAWGGQRMDHYRSCLESPALIGLLEQLRKSERSRLEDYALATGMMVKGLGVSFLTKLLFFLRPRRDAYILDQWIAKSLKFLIQPPCTVKLVKWGGPHHETTPHEYDEACLALEEIGALLGGLSGDLTEQLLFSRPSGEWRIQVDKAFYSPDNVSSDNRSSDKASRGRPRNNPAGASSDQVCQLCDLAKEVMDRHLEAVKDHRNVPPSLTPAVHHLCNRVSPCRVYCGREWGIEFYYHINKGWIRVGAFFPKAVANRYRDLEEQGLGISPDYWEGAKFGRGRETISLSIKRPDKPQTPEQTRQELINNAVTEMEDLFKLISQAIHT